MLKIIISSIVSIIFFATLWLYANNQETQESINIIETERPMIQEIITQEETIPEPITKEELTPYNIPLDKDIQKYIIEKCREYEIDERLVFALIQKESEFKIDAVNYNDDQSVDIGIMQINSNNFDWLTEKLGITNFFDPYQNIDAGLFMLGNYYQTYKDEHTSLVCFNMGESTMKYLASRGTYSSRYSREVIANKENIERKEDEIVSDNDKGTD